MAENINEEPLDKPVTPQSEDPLPDIINSKQETENMEVHKHPHHVMHKKKWTEYLLEFFMLFLAVFLGFVAENIRENIRDREVEKTNIESMLKNLQEDSLNLERSTAVNEKKIMLIDSLMDLKNSNVSDAVFNQHFVYYDLKLGYNDYFQSNQSTFDQMQSSGTLRLISHTGVLDSILRYEAMYKELKSQEGVCSVWWNKAIEQVSLIFDLTFVSQLPEGALWELTLNDVAKFTLSEIERRSPVVKLYFNWQANGRLAWGYYVNDLHKVRSYNRILISYLKKEYNIE